MYTKYIPTEIEEKLLREIVDCSFIVHTKLGPGLLERIYEVCFCHELRKKNINFSSHVKMPIVYYDLIFDDGFRIDVLVEDKIICELKAVNDHNPVFDTQLLSYLKLSKII